jgi:phosphatidylglycerol lysyltransferase
MTMPAKAPDAYSSRLAALASAALFLAALWVLRRELRAVRYHELTAALFALPAARVLLAGLLTAMNYGVLTLYDQLGFAYVGRRIERGRVALAAFVAYAIAHSVGFGLLSGTSVRYRFYSRWGLTASELSRLVIFNSATFWLGLLLLGGAGLAFAPPAAAETLAPAGAIRALGGLLLVAALAYPSAVGCAAAPCACATWRSRSPRVAWSPHSSWCRRWIGRWPPPSSTRCCRQAPSLSTPC